MNKEQKDFLAKNELRFDNLVKFQVDAVNSETKTISVILSDETKVIRWSWEKDWFDVILVHDINSVDLTRKDIMPLLVQHNTEMLPIGRWENIRIEDRKLKGDAVFDPEDEYAMEIFGKFERKFMQSFSVGLGEWRLQLFEDINENGRSTYKAVEWSLQECSVVTIPAIPNAKVGFSNQQEENQTENNTNENNLCYNSDVTNSNKEKKKMTKEEFKASHPDLYAQIFNDGEKQEKERVLAHIEMSKTTGATSYAMECIEKGENFNPLVQAKYLGFAMNKNDTNARNDENIPPVETPSSSEDAEDKKRDEAFEATFNLKV